jgi:hypothetical protein
MSAEPSTIRHPFSQARQTWDAWSDASMWQRVLQQARANGEEADLRRRLPQLDELTQGPGPLGALRANHQLVELLQGWQWLAVRAAREQGHGWHDIGQALDLDADQAKRAYLERVERKRSVAAANPDIAHLIGFEPRLVELAEPNDADRAHQHGRAAPGQEVGHER